MWFSLLLSQYADAGTISFIFFYPLTRRAISKIITEEDWARWCRAVILRNQYFECTV